MRRPDAWMVKWHDGSQSPELRFDWMGTCDATTSALYALTPAEVEMLDPDNCPVCGSPMIGPTYLEDSAADHHACVDCKAEWFQSKRAAAKGAGDV